jgi:hypothetical protein
MPPTWDKAEQDENNREIRRAAALAHATAPALRQACSALELVVVVSTLVSTLV